MSESNQVVFTKNEVVITDIKMPFGSMVVFMVKWAIAAIPAFIILAFIGMFVVGFLTSLTGPTV
jgi:CHASE2 domain-containing sensor protein